MTCIIFVRAHQPLFVISKKSRNASTVNFLERNNSLDATLAVGTTINIVAEENNCII